ncbi:MAG: hypothetical protein R2723_01085 [Microbacterium sp.]
MNTGHDAAQIEAIGEDPRDLVRVLLAHEPGTFFAYNSPATHALSAIVTAVTGELSRPTCGPGCSTRSASATAG